VVYDPERPRIASKETPIGPYKWFKLDLYEYQKHVLKQ
jgi:hypothetical protein